jgi:hypothetical protein
MRKKIDYLAEQGLTFSELSEDIKVELSVLRRIGYLYRCTYTRGCKYNSQNM